MECHKVGHRLFSRIRTRECESSWVKWQKRRVLADEVLKQEMLIELLL